MKKQTALIMAATIAALTLAGCGNKPAETTAATTTTTAATEATPETTPEMTTTAPAESVPVSETTTAEESGKTAVISASDGKSLYLEDGKMNEWDMLTFDSALVRLSTGMYLDSDTSPDLFVTDEFIYNGETADFGDIFIVGAGDTIGGLKIKSADTMFNPPRDENYEIIPDADSGYVPFESSVTLDGELTLTGIVRYYFDEQYAIESGDIHFIPDASYSGLPMMFDLMRYTGASEYGEKNGTVSFDVAGGYDDSHYGGAVCVYSDAPSFRVGNLLRDYSDRSDLYQLLGSGSANCTKKVEITLTDVSLSYSEQFGTTHCSAVIKSMKEI